MPWVEVALARCLIGAAVAIAVARARTAPLIIQGEGKDRFIRVRQTIQALNYSFEVWLGDPSADRAMSFQVPFAEGLRQTMDWYVQAKDPEEVARQLGVLLTERPTASW